MRGTKTDLLPEEQFMGEYGFGTGVGAVLHEASEEDLGVQIRRVILLDYYRLAHLKVFNFWRH